MIRKLKNTIEEKRKSKKLFWKLLVFGKDFAWRYILHNPLSAYCTIFLYDLKLKLNKKGIRSEKKEKQKIHIMYLTCKKHFTYLILSLKSLEKLCPKDLGSVYLFVDKRDFLDRRQIILIKELKLNICMQKSPEIHHDGVGLLIAELKAFKKVAARSSQDDYIAKVDSDILFISDKIFKDVMRSSAQIIGQKSTPNPAVAFPHTSGGCYFMTTSLIHKITNSPLRKFVTEVVANMSGRLVTLLPEDFVIFNLAKKYTQNIQFTRFYFPLDKIELLPAQQGAYSAIHFSEQKNQMLQVARTMGLVKDSLDKKAVFILGHARSGTTLLNVVLSAHPHIYFIKKEFNDYPLYNFDNAPGKKNLLIKNLLRRLELSHAIHISGNNYQEFMDNIFDFYRSKSKKNIIGVKVAINISENVDMIRSTFPNAYCIQIIRDPRDMALSLKKLNFGPTSAFYVAKAWKDTVDNIRKLKKCTNKYYEIKYEDLITHPESELKKLCVFLDISFSKRMLQFNKYVGEVSSIHGQLKKGFIRNNYDKWKSELKEKELRLMYAAAGKRIHELGYTKKEHKVQISFFKRLREYLSDKIGVRLRLYRNTGRFFIRPNTYNIIKKGRFAK